VSRLSLPWWGDLGAAVVLAMLALAAALAPVPASVEAVSLAPLVLLLPGYALTAVIFPPGALPRDERLIYVVALSFAASVIGGLIVQVVVPLERLAWAALLCGATVLAAFVALRRRRRRLPRGRGNRIRIAIRRPALFSAASLLCAVGLASVSVAIATDGADDQAERAQFSSLSVLPDGEGGASVEVANHEGRDSSYLVRISEGGAVQRRIGVELAPGEDLRARIDPAELSGEGPLLIELFRGGEIYRRAYLRTGASP